MQHFSAATLQNLVIFNLSRHSGIPPALPDGSRGRPHGGDNFRFLILDLAFNRLSPSQILNLKSQILNYINYSNSGLPYELILKAQSNPC